MPGKSWTTTQRKVAREELAHLERRRHLASWAINFCTSAALLVCTVIAALFATNSSPPTSSGSRALLFVGAMLALIGGLACFPARGLRLDSHGAHHPHEVQLLNRGRRKRLSPAPHPESGTSMPADNELVFTPARRLARMIAARKVSATEVVRAFIAQIERVNREVNAIVTFLPEAALKAAKALDRRTGSARAFGLDCRSRTRICCRQRACERRTARRFTPSTSPKRITCSSSD
jgi:hypothetical protein